MKKDLTILGKDKVSVIGLHASSKGGTMMLSTPKRVTWNKKPVHVLSFEDINIIDFTIKKLILLRRMMIQNGAPHKMGMPDLGEHLRNMEGGTIELHILNITDRKSSISDVTDPVELISKLEEIVGEEGARSILKILISEKEEAEQD